VPGFHLIHSHTEVAVVFSSSAGDDPEHISLDHVVDRLTTHTGNSRGRGGRPILRHGGTLNKKSLQFVLSQLGGGDLVNERKHCFHSYRELAAAVIGMPGALVIGLRGGEVIRPQLCPVLVDGLDPLDPVARRRYPLQYKVHVYLKDNLVGTGRSCGLQYLHTIRRRIAVDALSLFSAGGHVWARPMSSLAA
jgi:hypothetical protein